MMQQLLCDRSECGRIIQDGTERIDVTLPTTIGAHGRTTANTLFSFHVPCFQANGPIMPAPGLSVTVHRVPAATPPPLTPVLSAPVTAPA